ncbi:MAG: hypothetical protein SGPRY_011604, partial [Prymnesium sp.]
GLTLSAPSTGASPRSPQTPLFYALPCPLPCQQAARRRESSPSSSYLASLVSSPAPCFRRSAGSSDSTLVVRNLCCVPEEYEDEAYSYDNPLESSER